MVDPVSGAPFTAHTTDKVPFILVNPEYSQCRLRDDGALCDIAPTLLDILKIPAPPEMTGQSLIIKS